MISHTHDCVKPANVCCPNLEIPMFLVPSLGDAHGRGHCKIITQSSLVRNSQHGEHTYMDLELELLECTRFCW